MWSLVSLLVLVMGSAGSSAVASEAVDAVDVEAVIAKTRVWVQGYMESLPNFTCQKPHRVFMGPVIGKPKLRKWAVEMPKWVTAKPRWERPRIKLRTQGAQSIGRSGSPMGLGILKAGIGKVHESEWLVRMVKGQQESYEWIKGDRHGYGWGYLGSWLTKLFSEELQTDFQWIEDTELRGHGVHVLCRTVTPRNFYQYGGQRKRRGYFGWVRG